MNAIRQDRCAAVPFTSAASTTPSSALSTSTSGAFAVAHGKGIATTLEARDEGVLAYCTNGLAAVFG